MVGFIAEFKCTFDLVNACTLTCVLALIITHIFLKRSHSQINNWVPAIISALIYQRDGFYGQAGAIVIVNQKFKPLFVRAEMDTKDCLIFNFFTYHIIFAWVKLDNRVLCIRVAYLKSRWALSFLDSVDKDSWSIRVWVKESQNKWHRKYNLLYILTLQTINTGYSFQLD